MLKELSAKISSDLTEEVGQGEIPMLHLHTARIRLASAEVLPALLSCTPALTTLEISYDQDGSTPDLDDSTLEQAIKAMVFANDPPALHVRFFISA
jgi:allophanate hydrolase subunit 1